MNDPQENEVSSRTRDDSLIVEWTREFKQRQRELRALGLDIPESQVSWPNLEKRARERWWRDRVRWSVEDAIKDSTLPDGSAAWATAVAFEMVVGDDGHVEKWDFESVYSLGQPDLQCHEDHSTKQTESAKCDCVRITRLSQCVGRIHWNYLSQSLRGEFAVGDSPAFLVLVPVKPRKKAIFSRGVLVVDNVPAGQYLCALLTPTPLLALTESKDDDNINFQRADINPYEKALIPGISFLHQGASLLSSPLAWFLFSQIGLLVMSKFRNPNEKELGIPPLDEKPTPP